MLALVRAVAVAVAVAVAIASPPASAATVHSYAYVTSVERITTSMNAKYDKELCKVTARLPAGVLAQPPAAPPDLAHAAAITAVVHDPRDNCTHYAETWQPVSFDDAKRDHFEFDWPEGSLSIFDYLIGAAIAGGVLYFARDRYLARRARRPQRMA